MNTLVWSLWLTQTTLSLISHYLPSRSLRSSNTNLLTRPPGITSNFSSRAFSVSAPSTCNSLSTHIRSIDNLSTFKRHLKCHLPVCLYHLVILCQRLRFVLTIFGAIEICMYVCMYDVCMSLRLIRASIHPPALVKTFRFLSFITQHFTSITLNNTDTCFEPEASYGQSGDVVVYDTIRHEMLF